MPTKATPGAAAYDVYIPGTLLVKQGRQVLSLGFALELPDGYEAKIEPRSGFSSKGMLGSPAENATQGDVRYDCDVIQGKIDSDYRGDIGVIINNHDLPFYLKKGSRIAQMTIYKVEAVDFVQTEQLSETERGDGGFGHTNA